MTQDSVLAQPTVALDTQQKCPDPSVYVIPDDATRMIVQVARSTSAEPSKFPSPDTYVVVCGLASYDGGVTWENTGGTITTRGGITTGHEGEIGYANCECPIADGKNRLLRVHYAIFAGPPVTLDIYVAARNEKAGVVADSL